MPDEDGNIRRPSPAESNGTPYHLVEIYAHNAIHELILKVREEVRLERGRYTLPSGFVDQLEVDCGKWMLEKGAEATEKLAREHIVAFLEQRERLKREEDERKVRLRLPREP